MAKAAKDLLKDLGSEQSLILSAKRFVAAIVKSAGGMDQMAEDIVVLLNDRETPAGTKAAMYKSILGAILNINEAEAVHGEIVDEQTEALIQQLSELTEEDGDAD